MKLPPKAPHSRQGAFLSHVKLVTIWLFVVAKSGSCQAEFAVKICTGISMRSCTNAIIRSINILDFAYAKALAIVLVG
jgi:hypothetical protein